MSGLRPPRGVPEGVFREALGSCERVAGRDRSNLYLVSQYLRDRARYEAFLAMYSVMRLVDDEVDAIADIPGLPAPERRLRLDRLEEWRARIEAAYGAAGDGSADALDVALSAAVAAFPVPAALWEDFLAAMVYDVGHDRFPTPEEFDRYALGATAAPTTVFIYLLCSEAGAAREGGLPGDGPVYRVRERGDGFDYRSCGRHLGFFAYHAHILRDVAADLRIGSRGRIYIPISDLAESGLSEEGLREAVARGRGDGRWERLVGRIVGRARAHERAGTRLARARFAAMEPDCRFILALIIGMYRHLLGTIASDPGAVLRGLPPPSEAERRALLAAAAEDSGYRP